MNSLKLSASQLVVIVVVGILLIVGGILISTLTPSIFPVEASAEAVQVDGLFKVMFAIGGAIFLLVQGLLVFSVIRFRAKPHDTSDGMYLHGNTTLEIIWTVIPAIIVTVLTILAFNVLGTIWEVKNDEMVVQTTAARFNWAFSYDAPKSALDGLIDLNALPDSANAQFDANGNLAIASSELHTYVGQPVQMQMQSRDVIHAFWVPAFRVKQDVIPGRTTTVRFTPTLAGRYPIRCTELCGANHGLMVAEVIVHEDLQAYNAWLAQGMMEVLFPPADPVERGRKILSSNIYPCYTCHVLNDLTEFNWNGNVGPALNGVGDRSVNSRAVATGLSGADYLHQAVAEPSSYLVPGYGALMPILNLPECELQAVVAYLCTQTASGEPACTIDEYAFANDCGGGSAPPLLNAPASEATAEAAPVSAATPEATPNT